MSDDYPMIRWELDALKTEYNQHWSHFRHTIDKSYQAFNIHMVMMALLFSAVSLANDQTSTIAVPLFVVVSVVAYASSIGTISTLVTQRAGYLWYQKVIDVLRERISKKTTDVLQPEVDLFYDRKLFSPGTAWFGRVNFVILTGSSVVVFCSYLTLSGLSTLAIGITFDNFTSFVLSLFILALCSQKMYHSVIYRSLDRAWGLHCQLLKYENPSKERRDIKYIKQYSEYLLTFEIITLVCAIPVLLITPFIVIGMVVNLLIIAMTLRCWLKSKRDIECP
jgi:hypothetical protein